MLLDVDKASLAQRTTGNEFIYHCAAIRTVIANGKYAVGLDWIYRITIHIIPRILWRDRPVWASLGITPQEVAAQTGFWRSPGAAMGVIADMYTQFGVVSLVAFFVLGKVLRQLHDRALHDHSLSTLCFYSVCHALFFNLFAQDFGQILVPVAYAMFPVSVYWLISRRESRMVLVRSVQRMRPNKKAYLLKTS
jgi:hypothetical protein